MTSKTKRILLVAGISTMVSVFWFCLQLVAIHFSITYWLESTNSQLLEKGDLIDAYAEILAEVYGFVVWFGFIMISFAFIPATTLIAGIVFWLKKKKDWSTAFFISWALTSLYGLIIWLTMELWGNWLISFFQ
jgi:hypothetical protein